MVEELGFEGVKKMLVCQFLWIGVQGMGNWGGEGRYPVIDILDVGDGYGVACLFLFWFLAFLSRGIQPSTVSRDKNDRHEKHVPFTSSPAEEKVLPAG